jgi:hypoxanthine phosphoribosyltransferase
MPIDVMFSQEQIAAKVAELGARVKADYESRELLLVGILKGSIHFLSDLSRHLDNNTAIDFMQVSSYGAGKSQTGVVKILKDLDVNIEGKDVLLVEDILDTGVTLSHVQELLSTRKPASLEVATLLSKPEARRIDIPAKYVGFEIPNAFVVGYGLDYGERYRNLPYIGILRED